MSNASSAVVSVRQRRADRLGASDAPVVLGFVPTKGPINTWLRITGRQKDDTQNDAMMFGTAYEPIIRGHYVNRMGCRVWVPAESLLHPSLPFLQATPDGIVIRQDAPDVADLTQREHWSHGLEVKAPRARQRQEWGDEDSQLVPQHVVVQVVVQMSVLDLPFVDIAVECDRDYIQRRVHRDRDLEDDVLTALDEFWGYVKRDIPPPVDSTESYADYLKGKLAKAAQIIEATPAMERVVEDWADAEVKLKQAKDKCDLLKNTVMAELVAHDAVKMKTTRGPIVMQSGRVTYDDKSLAQDFCNRLQLRGEVVNFDDERQRYAKQGTPFPRRPVSWTKE